MKQCSEFTCVECLDGTCPIVKNGGIVDEIRHCKNCSYHKGCESCDFHDTDFCPYNKDPYQIFLQGLVSGNNQRQLSRTFPQPHPTLKPTHHIVPRGVCRKHLGRNLGCVLYRRHCTLTCGLGVLPNPKQNQEPNQTQTGESQPNQTGRRKTSANDNQSSIQIRQQHVLQ